MARFFSSKNVITLFLIAGFLFAVSFLIKDRDLILETILQMHFRVLMLAMLMASLSYICLSVAFAKSTKLLGVAMPFKKLCYLGYISTVIANMVSVAGVTGYTTKIALFKKHDLRVSQITAFTLFFGNISNIALILLLPFGLSTLTTMKIDLSFELIILIALFLVANLSIFVGPVRRHIFNAFLKFLRNRKQSDSLDARFKAINEHMDKTIAVTRKKPREVLNVLALTSLNWLFAVLALGVCFYALGVHLPFGILIVGFTVGLFIGVISIIPGGMGVQEATMAGVFALLGVKFGVAILAAMIFRLIYQVLPFFCGLALAKRWDRI